MKLCAFAGSFGVIRNHNILNCCVTLFKIPLGFDNVPGIAPSTFISCTPMVNAALIVSAKTELLIKTALIILPKPTELSFEPLSHIAIAWLITVAVDCALALLETKFFSAGFEFLDLLEKNRRAT